MVGTIDLGGAPEQAVSDGKGHIYVDLEDKDSVAVVDAKAMTVTATYASAARAAAAPASPSTRRTTCCSPHAAIPQNMVMLNADDGKILAALPIGSGATAPPSIQRPWKRSARRATAR